MLHLHSPALGKTVVSGGEEKGSRHRNETKCSCGHSCGLSPAPGEAGMALVKALTALKPAGIAEKMHRRESPDMKNLFLMWREPITECKADPAVPSLCRVTEGSEHMLIPSHRCLYLTLSAPAGYRCMELPASAGTGRRPPVCLEQCTGSKKAVLPIMGDGESHPPPRGYPPAPNHAPHSHRAPCSPEYMFSR